MERIYLKKLLISIISIFLTIAFSGNFICQNKCDYILKHTFKSTKITCPFHYTSSINKSDSFYNYIRTTHCKLKHIQEYQNHKIIVHLDIVLIKRFIYPTNYKTKIRFINNILLFSSIPIYIQKQSFLC
ncbi:MAG: hypothetical protein KatS3mg129_1214 [Leptospiraceae bacterium]|nr:MAG: hypothetical protein KatS3mg129_1214 [Leptospiraceae bacterium]